MIKQTESNNPITNFQREKEKEKEEEERERESEEIEGKGNVCISFLRHAGSISLYFIYSSTVLIKSILFGHNN